MNRTRTLLAVGCDLDRTCACLSSAVCVGLFDVCIDPATVNELRCECPTC